MSENNNVEFKVEETENTAEVEFEEVEPEKKGFVTNIIDGAKANRKKIAIGLAVAAGVIVTVIVGKKLFNGESVVVEAAKDAVDTIPTENLLEDVTDAITETEVE